MKICRFDDDRIGLVQEDKSVLDVTGALNVLPLMKWPVPLGDAFILNLESITSEMQRLAPDAPSVFLSDITLKSPVAKPSKIIDILTNEVIRG